MTSDLIASLGLYGGTAVIAFLAGLFPLISIEVFLGGISVYGVAPAELAILVPIAAVGHQIAKTICYYAGVGALERGPIKAKLEKVRPRIDRWNRAPNLVMLLAATVGLPPLYLMTFIAEPLMRMRFWRFTLICFGGRIGRFAFIVTVMKLF